MRAVDGEGGFGGRVNGRLVAGDIRSARHSAIGGTVNRGALGSTRCWMWSIWRAIRNAEHSSDLNSVSGKSDG